MYSVSQYQPAFWNTFRFVRLNQQQATLVFILHSHIEFYLTYQTRKLCFDLTDLMDIDQLKEKNTCRVALKPPAKLSTNSPLILSINFESTLSYDRFIDLLVRSQVFYYPEVSRTTGGARGWFGSLRRNQSLNKGTTKHSTSEQQHQSNELKLVPERTQQLRNYLHLLDGWKDTNSM